MCDAKLLEQFDKRQPRQVWAKLIPDKTRKGIGISAHMPSFRNAVWDPFCRRWPAMFCQIALNEMGMIREMEKGYEVDAGEYLYDAGDGGACC
jgi:hypothetical protein